MDRRSKYLLRPTVSSLQLLGLLFLCLAVGSQGSRKTGKSSVFSLFNLKQKSKFWSESVIRTNFDDLESSSPGVVDVLNYTKSGNIASYLKLFEVDSLYLPVPVNFIFIGFDGKGNQDFMLGLEELERWFTKIDHIFEHMRVPPIGEALSPFYKIIIDKTRPHHQLPVISHINYNFSVHAIQMGEKVTNVFEHAIHVLSRKDNVSDTRDDGKALWQVDVDTMGLLFKSLLEYFQLEDAYNIFILNPKHNPERASYG